MVQFVLEQPPPRFQASATRLFPLSRGKGGEGDRTRRNSCLNSPSPLLGKGPGVRALFLKIFAGHHTRAERRIPDPFFSTSRAHDLFNPVPLPTMGRG